MRKRFWQIWFAALAMATWPPVAPAATFGTVVAIGGQAADIALDEARGVLYVANFTASRVDVVSLADRAVGTSFNVAPQPNGVALSPDGTYLVVTHYGPWQPPNTNKSALTVIKLLDGSRQTFALGYPPLGVAFGADGLALVVTTQDILLFDPVSGATQALSSAADLAAKALPVPAGTAPPSIVQASVAASGDGLWIFGLCDIGEGVVRYRYDMRRKALSSFAFTASPPMGPRVIAASRDGSYYTAGWALFRGDSTLISQFHTKVSGKLDVGTHVIDQASNTVYAQVPEPGATEPLLMVADADNLNVRETLRLPENFTGKSVLNAAADTMYGVSDSGVLILPLGSLASINRVTASQPDMVFRGGTCDSRVMMTQEIAIVDPGGGRTDFRLRPTSRAVTVTPTSGVTPAVVRVQIDPSAFSAQNGTSTLQVDLFSNLAVNVPSPIRVLINGRNPDQRGTVVNVPGNLVDLLADPLRDRFYILRQDTNEVLVFDGTTYQQLTSLRTSNTPTQMAFTFDRKYLLIGHNNSQYVYVYDLDSWEQQLPIAFPFGHYPRSIAVSGKTILGCARLADDTMKISTVDLPARRATELPSLGVFENKLPAGTVLVGSPNGSTILAASPDGHVMLYSASADTFIASRKDFAALSGAYAASSYEFYVVDNNILNASLVPVRKLDASNGASSGFVFVDDFGFRSTAAAPTVPGVIQRVDMATGLSLRPTRMVEAPLQPVVYSNQGAGFIRTLAALRNRSAVISLSVSGFTVLPWNYDAATVPPRIQKVVNAADQTLPVAPGSLITVWGSDFSPVNIATREMPLPTALGESCLTVNGVALPMLFVSPGQINAQLPFNLDGRATMVLRTPGGVSDSFNITILPTAPSVFRSGTAGPDTGIATVMRARNGELVTGSNPIHPEDAIVIFATGLGRTDPEVEAGTPAPSDPLPQALIPPEVTLGDVPLAIAYAGLAPGQIGVYQINAVVPSYVPEGMEVPLTITQGGYSTTLPVRVVK